MIVTDILLDGLFAAVAAIGFGAISDPPMRAFPRIALLAAIGHALRFTLIHCAALDIATASLFAAFAIGMGSLWLGRGVRCPMTCLYIPALLPMVPGIYAYKTVFSLIMFLQSLDRADEGMRYMQQFFLNATVSLSVIALLAAGATLPIFIFKRRAFSMTRRTRNLLEHDRGLQCRNLACADRFHARGGHAACATLPPSDARSTDRHETLHGVSQLLDRRSLLHDLLPSARISRHAGAFLGHNGWNMDL